MPAMPVQASCTALSFLHHAVNVAERPERPGQDRLSGKLLRLPKPIIEIVDYIHTVTFVDLPHLF